MVLKMDVKTDNFYVNEALRKPYFKEILYYFSKEHSEHLKHLIQYIKEKKPVNRDLLIDLNNRLITEQAQRKQLVETCKMFFGDSFMKNVKELEEYMNKRLSVPKEKMNIKLTNFREVKDKNDKNTSKESQRIVKDLNLKRLNEAEREEIEKMVDRYIEHFSRMKELIGKQNAYISEKETELMQRISFLEKENELLQEVAFPLKEKEKTKSRKVVERKIKTATKIKQILNETEYSLMMLNIPLFNKEDITAPRKEFLEGRKKQLRKTFDIPSEKELVVISHTAELYRDILVNESPHIKPVALFYKEGMNHWVKEEIHQKDMWNVQSFLMERILDDSNLTFSDFQKLDEQQIKKRQLIVPYGKGQMWFGMNIRTAKNYNELIQYILWFQQTVRMVGSSQPFYFLGYFM